MKNLRFAILFFSVALTASSFAKAQENMSVGGLISASSYVGDLSSSFVMRYPGAYLGALVHYSMSEYYNIRVGLGAGNIRSDPSTAEGHLASNVSYQKPVAFNQLFFDIDARVEFGFMPYESLEHNPKKQAFSPYFALGAGVGYCRGAPFAQFPVAVGAKYRIAYRFTLGAEWTFRKTFNDSLDGWENARVSSGTTLNNNDWISYIGVYLTYQLSEKGCCHDEVAKK
ncbi:MAG: DUF6089 family protein [Prevotellaceae bacterium]|nr:DUF6089 family protein [Prevotellaceae bacterium]